MTELPDQLRDFDGELEPAAGNFFAGLGWARRTPMDRDYVDELQAWVDDFEPRPQCTSALPTPDAPPDVAAQVDRAAGEYFRGTWRRRLADAQGDCGYVARQMRKAGVPLDLALVILLIPDEAFESRPTPSPKPETGGWSEQESNRGLPAPRVPWPSSLRLAVAA